MESQTTEGLVVSGPRIERGVPVPGAKYPLREMEVGDSFVVPYSRSAQTCVHGLARKLPQFTITTKREGENMRVWRVA